jgi:hypothetical protein
MNGLLRRVAFVCIIGLLVIVVSRHHRRHAHERFEAAKRHANDECRAFRHERGHENAAICQAWDEFGPSAIDRWRVADRLLAEADAHVRANDPHAADAALIDALAVASETESRGRMLDTLVAANIVRRVLDAANNPSLDRAAILRHASLPSLEHPLEAMRLHHEWTITHLHELGEPEIAEGKIADVAPIDDAAYRTMEARILASDPAGCIEAARPIEQGIRPLETAEIVCTKLVATTEIRARLEAARRALD